MKNVGEAGNYITLYMTKKYLMRLSSGISTVTMASHMTTVFLLKRQNSVMTMMVKKYILICGRRGRSIVGRTTYAVYNIYHDAPHKVRQKMKLTN